MHRKLKHTYYVMMSSSANITFKLQNRISKRYNRGVTTNSTAIPNLPTWTFGSCTHIPICWYGIYPGLSTRVFSRVPEKYKTLYLISPAVKLFLCKDEFLAECSPVLPINIATSNIQDSGKSPTSSDVTSTASSHLPLLATVIAA